MQRIAFLTQHGKAPLVADVLAPLGWEVQLVTGFDTDQLGSFAGERSRFMSAAECALRKAAIAAELAGTSLGLGSEGSFTAGPYGVGTINVELLCCVNVDEGWSVLASAKQFSHARSWQLAEASGIQSILSDIPHDQLLLVKQELRIVKAVRKDQLEVLAREWVNSGPLFIEYDLRAHCCPQRQQVIRLAAENLVQRIQASCPHCGTPGFWPEQIITGLPCADCGQPTHQARGYRASCQRCEFQQEHFVSETYADPAHCAYCNP